MPKTEDCLSLSMELVTPGSIVTTTLRVGRTGAVVESAHALRWTDPPPMIIGPITRQWGFSHSSE